MGRLLQGGLGSNPDTLRRVGRGGHLLGWIDGLINGIDDERYKRRFTSRKSDSKWSKKNKERVQAMVEAGKMTSAGKELVEAARESGEWEQAYRLADDHKIPDELKAALKGNETVWEHFQAFSNTDQHAYIAQVEEAKTEETRQRRIERTVELAGKTSGSTTGTTSGG